MNLCVFSLLLLATDRHAHTDQTQGQHSSSCASPRRYQASAHGRRPADERARSKPKTGHQKIACPRHTTTTTTNSTPPRVHHVCIRAVRLPPPTVASPPLEPSASTAPRHRARNSPFEPHRCCEHSPQNRQADSARRVDVGVEDDRVELALRRLGRVLVSEDHGDLVAPALPRRAGLARDAADPLHHVRRPVRVFRRAREKPVRVVLAPRFALLAQPPDRDARHWNEHERRPTFLGRLFWGLLLHCSA